MLIETHRAMPSGEALLVDGEVIVGTRFVIRWVAVASGLPLVWVCPEGEHCGGGTCQVRTAEEC